MDIDISKQRVERTFEKVFGYNLSIDPLIHKGLAVRKSNINYAHDGAIINCPIDAACINKEYVYQRLIDNQADDNNIVDIRVAYANRLIELVTLKYRALADRFGTISNNAVLANIKDIFSSTEIENIQSFVMQMQLDYCEMDILRDAADKRIYIVDCNSTPSFGPPAGLKRSDAIKYLQQ